MTRSDPTSVENLSFALHEEDDLLVTLTREFDRKTDKWTHTLEYYPKEFPKQEYIEVTPVSVEELPKSFRERREQLKNAEQSFHDCLETALSKSSSRQFFFKGGGVPFGDELKKLYRDILVADKGPTLDVDGFTKDIGR